MSEHARNLRAIAQNDYMIDQHMLPTGLELEAAADALEEPGRILASFHAYEREDVKTLARAGEMKSAAWEFQQYLRGLAKHGPETVNPQDIYERWFEVFGDLAE